MFDWLSNLGSSLGSFFGLGGTGETGGGNFFSSLFGNLGKELTSSPLSSLATIGQVAGTAGSVFGGGDQPKLPQFPAPPPQQFQTPPLSNIPTPLIPQASQQTAIQPPTMPAPDPRMVRALAANMQQQGLYSGGVVSPDTLSGLLGSPYDANFIQAVMSGQIY